MLCTLGATLALVMHAIDAWLPPADKPLKLWGKLSLAQQHTFPLDTATAAQENCSRATKR
jgi:hypothetical protein